MKENEKLKVNLLGNDKKQELGAIKDKIDSEARRRFYYEFLSYTGLREGDVVRCNFHYNYGTAKQSFGTSKIADGIIKRNELGDYWVESIDDFEHTRSRNNGRTGRAYRSWWEYEKKKSIRQLIDIL